MNSLWVKLLVTALVVAALAATVDLGQAVARIGSIGFAVAVLGLVIGLGQIAVLAWRWVLVSRTVGLDLRRSEALRCMLASQFFSQGLPASIGGDALRFWWLTRIGARPAAAVQSVLLDRVAGLVALVILNLIAVAALALFVRHAPNLSTLSVIVAVVAAVVAVGASRPMRGLMIGLFRRLPAPLRARRGARRLLRWLVTFHRSTTCLIYTRSGLVILGWGIVVHVAAIAVCWLVARDARLGVSLVQLLTVVPPVLLLSYMPLSIGGWGLREGAMAFGLSLVGLPASDGVFLGLALGTLGLGSALLGAIVWLVSPMPVTLFGNPRPRQARVAQ